MTGVLSTRTSSSWGGWRASYLAQFAKSHGVELADALVAAAAVTSGLQLWTLNRKHYQRFAVLPTARVMRAS